MNWDIGEVFSLGTQGVGMLTSALGAFGQAKTAKINAQAQYQHNQYLSERQYAIDLFNAKRAHQQSVYEAEQLGLQGLITQQQLRHQEQMSARNAERERLNLQHQADMARINAGFANADRVAARREGEHAAARYSLAAGNARASMRANMAGRGLVIGEGSTQDLLDSADLMKQIDMDTIQRNAIAEAFGHEVRGTDFLNQAASMAASKESVMGQYYGADTVRTQYSADPDMSQYVMRQPVYDQSGTINPGLHAVNSLMGNASAFASNWYESYKRNNPLNRHVYDRNTGGRMALQSAI